tara:strand:+ start:390 stop:1091 length:702 start_codon:yes stop_codon:yes gene_type:complete
MRKIFIDGGANEGQSTDKWIKYMSGSNEFEIYMIEPQKSCKQILKDVMEKYKDYHIEYLPKVIWNNSTDVLPMYHSNNKCTESAGVIFKKTNHTKEHKAETLHLSEWIRDNFNPSDYIVLKLDIEGSEYKVIEDLYRTETLSYINEIHGELHGVKKSYNINDDLKLITRLKEYNLNLWHWNGNNDRFKKSYYTDETTEREHKKWEKRDGLKPNWVKLEQYRNNYEEWYSENMV